MARVTVQDAVDKIGNRFDLIQVASRRARQMQRRIAADPRHGSLLPRCGPGTGILLGSIQRGRSFWRPSTFPVRAIQLH